MKSNANSEVQEFMSTDLVLVRENQTVHDAVTLMCENEIAALPVIAANGSCVGIVSAADMLRQVQSTEQVLDSKYPHFDDCLWAVDLIQSRLGTDHVDRVMSEVITTVAPDTPMHHAACIMLNHHVHHLPVVRHDGKLVGLLSSVDFVRMVSYVKRADD